MHNFEVYAHRGGSYPPNSLYSFGFAARVGADGIEADISLTADSDPIIYHPGTLDPAPCLMPWREVSTEHCFVPHLDDFLDFMSACPKLKCLLDIKQYSYRLMDIIVDKLQYGTLYKRVFLTTPKKKMDWLGLHTDTKLIDYARRFSPYLKSHIIETLPFDMAGTARYWRADMISFGWLNDSIASMMLFDLLFKKKLMNMDREVRKAQNTGARVMAGIANTEEDIRGLLLLAPTLDAIITDNPEMALAIRRFNIRS